MVANPIQRLHLAIHHEVSPPDDPGSSLGQDSVSPSLGNRTAGSWSKDEEEAQQTAVSMATAAHARINDARCVERSLVGLHILVASYQCVSAESLNIELKVLGASHCSRGLSCKAIYQPATNATVCVE